MLNNIAFEVPTDAAVMASIDAALAGPSANDYYNAAGYYFSEGKDAMKADRNSTAEYLSALAN